MNSSQKRAFEEAIDRANNEQRIWKQQQEETWRARKIAAGVFPNTPTHLIVVALTVLAVALLILAVI